MRHAAKRDTYEDAIVAALQAAQVNVRRISDAGLPDLLTWRGTDIRLIEVKSPRGHFTPRQKMWKLIGLPVFTAFNVDQALEVWGIRVAATL